MPATCDALGVTFDYPENWKLDVPDSDDPSQQVVVSSPETAFWQLCKYPRETEFESLFDEALAALRSEYRSIEAFPANDIVDGREVAGYDVNFYCLDLTITARLRGLAGKDANYLLLVQAEDRELDRLTSVLSAMLVSLIRGLDAA